MKSSPSRNKPLTDSSKIINTSMEDSENTWRGDGNDRKWEDKEFGKAIDVDSGLVVDYQWDSSASNISENADFLENELAENVRSKCNINVQKVANPLNTTTRVCGGDSGLELDSDFGFKDALVEKDENTKSGLRSRVTPLENITNVLRNAENISKQCSRIINQISPAHRMRLVDDAFSADKDGDTRLHLAVVHNRLDVIFTLIYLVPHPAYLDLQNDLCQTSLHLAVLTGQHRVVRRLVLAGASPNLRDRRGNTPLHLACERGDLECVKELTRPVTSIEFHYLRLMNSAVYQSLPNITIPPNLEIHNYEGRTCVHIATLNQHTEILLWLKQFGANINAQESKGGRTPLTFAVEARNSNLVGFLVEECNADIDVKNYAGLSAFQIAYRLDEKIANQLESLGAFPSYAIFSDSDSELECMDTSDENSLLFEYNEIEDDSW